MATKNPKVEKTAAIHKRRLRVAELLKERKTLVEIAAAVGVKSHATIHNDVKVLFDEWRQLRVTNTEDIAMSQLAELVWIIEEARGEWEKSKERKRIKAKYEAHKLDEKGKPVAGMKPDELEVVSLSPESKYLETIIRAGESLRKLFGVDKPIKVAQTDPEGNAIPIPVMAIFEKLSEAEVRALAVGSEKKNGKTKKQLA